MESRRKRRSALLAMQEEGKSAEEIMETLSISRATYYREIAAIATNSVLENVKDVLEEGKEKITQIIENAVEIVSNVVEQTTETVKVEVVGQVVKGTEYAHNAACSTVSKIKPYNYESKAKPCRTGIFSGIWSDDGGSG